MLKKIECGCIIGSKSSTVSSLLLIVIKACSTHKDEGYLYLDDYYTTDEDNLTDLEKAIYGD